MKALSISPPVSELILSGICDAYSRFGRGIVPGPYFVYATKYDYPNFPKCFSLAAVDEALKHLRNCSIANFGFDYFNRKCIVGLIIIDYISNHPFNNWCDRNFLRHAHIKCPYRFSKPFHYKPQHGKRLYSDHFTFDPRRLPKTDQSAAQTYRLEWNKPRSKFTPKIARPRKFNFTK